jgi:hypothetical protein
VRTGPPIKETLSLARQKQQQININMHKTITTLLALVACSGIYAADHSNPGHDNNGRIKPPLAPLTVLCFSSTPGSTTLTIRAGATGAPAGFSVQWMKAAELAALGGRWPSDENSFCGADFSGVPLCINYNLTPDAEVQIAISDALIDACGTSNQCNTPLDCNTVYAFRAFAHANNQFQRSPFSYGQCSTAPCGGGTGGCTHTQGYWENHPNTWPVQNVMLGTLNYPQVQLLQIFNRPAAGNGLVALAHQLTTAKLNIANGADPSAIQSAVTSAGALIGTLIVPPIGNGFLSPGTTSTLTNELYNYNMGVTGPGHCH